MRYRSLADLANSIDRNLNQLPNDIDLVVGIPRSGLLAANLIALARNLQLVDLDGLLHGRVFETGHTRRRPEFGAAPRHALVVDDSINTGTSMAAVRERIAAAGVDLKISYCAVYGTKESQKEVDILFEVVPLPRLFQWNFMHHAFLEHCCLDIDGVLCADPRPDQNDDGDEYLKFLKSATPLLTPGFKVGHLVTSRLERYRSPTEEWLKSRGIRYGKLWMLDLPTAQARREARAHARFKAQVYRRTDALLFVESELAQAEEIAQLSRRPVLSIEGHRMVDPGPSLVATLANWEATKRRYEASGLYQPRRQLVLDLVQFTKSGLSRLFSPSSIQGQSARRSTPASEGRTIPIGANRHSLRGAAPEEGVKRAATASPPLR